MSKEKKLLENESAAVAPRVGASFAPAVGDAAASANMKTDKELQLLEEVADMIQKATDNGVDAAARDTATARKCAAAVMTLFHDRLLERLQQSAGDERAALVEEYGVVCGNEHGLAGLLGFVLVELTVSGRAALLGSLTAQPGRRHTRGQVQEACPDHAEHVEGHCYRAGAGRVRVVGRRAGLSSEARDSR